MQTWMHWVGELMLSIVAQSVAVRCTFLVFVAAVMMAASSCSILRRGSNNLTLGSESSLTGQATLLCSQECSDRGQCGTADQGPMILLSSSGPATSGHDMAIPENTAVVIDHEESRTAVQLSNNDPFRASFYMVNVPERGPGWVAGWCIAQ